MSILFVHDSPNIVCANYKQDPICCKQMYIVCTFVISCSHYSHLFNKRGARNKRGGGAKVTKSLNVEVGINVEGGIFWKKTST